jgi:Mn2+/Fe2+ NRAMP family transporter
MIAGAADNDPTSVASISVIGATTLYRLSWLTILVYPMLATIQVISAEVGTVTRRSLQRDTVRVYGKTWGLVLLVSVLAVNLITLSADLEAGAAALGLMIGIPLQWLVLPFAAGTFALLALGTYAAVQRLLKWVMLVFLAYVASTFLAHPDWGAVFHATVVPSLRLDTAYMQGALALLGTTLTSYAYVWETIEEAEERPPIDRLGLARVDAGVGMLIAVAVFWFILVGTGATLGAHHHQVQTAQDAASALAPVAGPAASYIFAIGLLASAVLAVPVLAATTAYVIDHELGWKGSLKLSVWRASPFYIAIAATLLIGMIVSFAGVSPIQLLFIASVAGGLGTPISLTFLLLVARNRTLMGNHAPGRVLTIAGWATLLIVSAVSVFFLWQQASSLL